MSKKYRACLAILTLASLIWGGGNGIVSAQAQVMTQTEPSPEIQLEEVPVVTEEADDQPIIMEKLSLEAEIKAARDTYRAQFEAYRTAERNFTVAKQQHEQLATLAALEEAVQASREVMKRRSEVILTYLEILRLELTEAEGIEIALKDQALTDLVTQIQLLRAHLITVEAIENRAQVAAAVAEFTKLRPPVEEISYRVLSILNIGKLRLVYDKAGDITGELQANAAEAVNPLQQGERDRAFTETFRVLDTAQAQFQTVDVEFDRVKGRHSQATYNLVNRELGKIYASLAQIVSYLEELT